MSLMMSALLISLVWLLGFGIYMYLSSQQRSIEKEIDTLQRLLGDVEE